MMAPNLRPYQAEAFRELCRELAQQRSTLVVHPTGTGKTVLFTHAVVKAGGRCLVLAHRSQLVTQTAMRIRRDTGLSVGVDMGDQRPDQDAPEKVIVATVQTMAARLDEYDRDAFSLIVVDEAHHTVSPTYRAILDHFSKAKVLGVTATPDRLDGDGLGRVFDSVAHVYDILDAINEGWLCPIRQESVTVYGLDLSTLKVSRKTKDYTHKSLREQLATQEAVREVTAPLIEIIGDRPTILFAIDVAHAHALADALNDESPGIAVALSGKTDPKTLQAAIADFESGAKRIIVNCALLTEGFDAPHTACVAIARPTQSRALYAQMVGRGTRLHPSKSDCLVVNFVPANNDHTLMCPAAILDGTIDPEVQKVVDELQGQNPDRPLHDILPDAAEIVAHRKRIAFSVRARYERIEVDPFRVIGADDRAGRRGGEPATSKQLAYLASKGIRLREKGERKRAKSGALLESLDRMQAAALIDTIRRRQRAGLCSYRMAVKLAQFGLSPDVPFDDAKEAIDAIAANDWQKPAPMWLYADPRFAITSNNANKGGAS